MRKVWVLVCALTLLVAGSAGSAAAQPESDPPGLRLKAGTFSPVQGEALGAGAGLTISGYAAGTRGYYVVQFSGPVQQAWITSLEGAGGEILAYLPDFAYKVRMNPAQAAAVADQENVAWVGVFQPAYKIDPGLSTSGVNLYRIRIERGGGVAAAIASIRSAGAEVIRASGNHVVVAVDGAKLAEIAQVLDVAWIDGFTFFEKHNEYGAGAIVGGNVANASGFDGSTQIAAVADTGIGDGTAAGAHVDIPVGRVVGVFNWTAPNAPQCYNVLPDGAVDVDSGHGTHTAVSVVGDGDATGRGRGTAPAAGLVFQAVEEYLDTFAFCAGSPDGYYLVGIPDDLRDLYQQAYNAGARIHSNSWGSSVAGDYTLDSANTDDFVWNNRDMAITFSAGNSGVDTNNDGIIDNDSIGSPGTAKNVITVGASENDRGGDYACDTTLSYVSHDAYQPGQTCSSMGGQNLLGTWGSRYGFVGPWANDLTAGNAEQMAGWSSRGPTDDGRIKPDVVAPGTWVLSGYSSLYQEGYGDPVNPRNGIHQWDGWGMPVSDAYKYMGGTSMSNPIVAGAATVVRDFYQKTDGHSASAALVKATLINSAVDLADENNDGANDNDFPIPNVHEGWGRVDLANATDRGHVYVDNTAGLATGSVASYQFTVGSPGAPFKVSTVWSDYPSTETAAVNLVNNLNLTVTSPGGTVYRGNVFSGGWSQAGGSADNVNNVENVYVQSAESGVWTVEVSGFNVPMGGTQPFALVVDAQFGGQPDSAPSVTLVAPAEGATVSGQVSVQITADDDNDPAGSAGLVVEWQIDGGPWQPAVHAGGTSYTASWDSTAVPDGSHTVTARATDSLAQATTDSNAVVVDNVVEATMHVGDLDGYSSRVSGSWNAVVDVAVHDAVEGPVGGAVVNGMWSGGAGGPGSCTTDATGTCRLTSASLGRVSSATFTVEFVTHGSLTYDAGANHDVDGSSNGTGITVSRNAPAPPPPPPPPGLGMHAGDLDGSSVVSGGRWTATAVITVHDESHAPVSNATVSGSWSNGVRGTGSCVTDSAGMCVIVRSGIRTQSTSVTFSITGITHGTLVYGASNNHDPDGDSDGTVIVIPAP